MFLWFILQSVAGLSWQHDGCMLSPVINTVIMWCFDAVGWAAGRLVKATAVLRSLFWGPSVWLHSHWHEYISGYPCTSYSKHEYACIWLAAAVHINTNCVRVWFALIQVVSAQVLCLGNPYITYYTAHSKMCCNFEVDSNVQHYQQWWKFARHLRYLTIFSKFLVAHELQVFVLNSYQFQS